jgi:hypothetical protein
MKDVISSEGVSPNLITMMESFANALLGSPVLPAPKRELMVMFVDALKNAKVPEDLDLGITSGPETETVDTTSGTDTTVTSPETGTGGSTLSGTDDTTSPLTGGSDTPPTVTEASGPPNPWMVANSITSLFLETMVVAILLAQIAREFSKLEQNINNIRIHSALEQKDLAIAVGKLRAQQIMMDAAKSFTEAGMNLGMAIVSGAFLMAKTASVKNEKAKYVTDVGGQEEWDKLPKKDRARIELDITTNASRKYDDLQQMTSSGFQAAVKVILGSLDVKKSMLEGQASSMDATKQYIDKCLEMMSDTAAKLREEPGQIRNLLQELLRGLKEIQDQSTQGAWRA